MGVLPRNSGQDAGLAQLVESGEEGGQVGVTEAGEEVVHGFLSIDHDAVDVRVASGGVQ